MATTVHGNVIVVEEWTKGDPLEMPEGMRARLLEDDVRVLTRANAHLINIARKADALLTEYERGAIKCESAAACLALAELGNSLVPPAAWRRV